MNPKVEDERIIKLGPYGASSSNYGIHWDDKGQRMLKSIFISHDDACISSIQTLSILESEKARLSDRHGGDGPFFKTVEIDYPAEFLTGINGYYIEVHDLQIGGFIPQINCLTFETNQRKIGPIGQENGIQFCIQLGTRFIFQGFHGTSDQFRINSIGVYFDPHSD